ncbi:phage portal protein [bacterium]|nr:phage portal protein [bacterium]
MSTAQPKRSRSKKTSARSYGGWGALVNATAGTEANIRIDEQTAMTCSAVYASVRLLSETIGSLPLVVYERQMDGKRRADDNAVYRVLHDTPNPFMSAMVFRETMMCHVLLWGNAYAEIIVDGLGVPQALYLVEPWRVKPEIRRGELVYVVRVGVSEDGRVQQERVISSADMLHIPGLGFNGLVGQSVIGWAKETIAVSIAADRFGSSFFGKSARPSGVLQHPGQLDDEGARRLRDSWQTTYGGSGNVGKVAVLEEGMTFNPISIPPEDAQFLETRQFQVTEIARWFRVPPHMIGDLSRATFSNIEHQGIDFVVHSVRPWLVRLEQEFNRKLFTQGPFFCEHLVDGLLRGDIASRYNAYAIGRNWGWLSADDVRRMENLNPLPDGQGESYLIPTNMMRANQPAPETPPQEQPPAATPAARSAHREAIRDAAQRMVAIENNSMRRQAPKGVAAFRVWADGFFDKQANRMSQALTPSTRAYMESVGDDRDTDGIIAGIITRHLSDLRIQLADAQASDSDLASVIDSLAARRESDVVEKLVSQLMEV